MNFFAHAEPFLAIASVVEVGEPEAYHWRCYLGRPPAAGVAPNLSSAEVQVLEHYRALLETTASRRFGLTVPGEGGQLRADRHKAAALADVHADP